MKTTQVIPSIARRAFLSLGGLIAVGIAAAIWTVPAAFYGSYGIDLGGDVNLMNELKAPAGMLFAAGLAILAGAVRTSLASTSMVVAAALYLSFGASRFASFAVDGMPNDSLVAAAVLEVAIGAIAVFGVIAHRKQSTT